MNATMEAGVKGSEHTAGWAGPPSDEASRAAPPQVAHLLPEVAGTLDWPVDRRIAFARRDLWIEHEHAARAMRKLRDVLAHPRTEQMPCVLVAAVSRNGKSTVLKRFSAENPPRLLEGKPTIPVVSMQMPAKPKETDFWTEMLDAMKVGHRVNAAVALKRDQAMANLRTYGSKVLVIDEIHNVLQGTVPEQRAFLAFLKNLTNSLYLPIVAAGTQDAVRTLNTDEQFGDRFDVAGLPRWRLDAEYRKLLASWERLMPLRHPSGLDDREIATKLFDLSNRTIGSMTKIVKAATVAAIEGGQERITADLLDMVAYSPLRDFKVQDL